MWGAKAPTILVECPCAIVRVAGKIFRRRVVPTVAVASERLCDY